MYLNKNKTKFRASAELIFILLFSITHAANNKHIISNLLNYRKCEQSTYVNVVDNKVSESYTATVTKKLLSFKIVMCPFNKLIIFKNVCNSSATIAVTTAKLRVTTERQREIHGKYLCPGHKVARTEIRLFWSSCH